MPAPRAGAAKSIHTEPYAALVRLLRLSRQEAGLSQSELAKRLGQAQTYVSKCELAERRLDLLEWLSWMEAVGTPPGVFLRRLRQAMLRRPRSPSPE